MQIAKKHRLGITSKTAFFCCGSERTLHGETTAEEIGVRPIPCLWRQDNRDVFAFSLSWFEHSKGVEDVNYLVAYPSWFISLDLNLSNHSESPIVILRLLNSILNFRSWADKSPHYFESELCIIPHLKIASNKRMCHCTTTFTLLGYYSNSICQVNPFFWRQGELWSFGIDCYFSKSIFIKIRIMLSFPCCQKRNRVTASQPALY